MGDGDQDDRELLRAWHAGSQAAGTALYRRHEAPLRRFFASKAPPQDTDELVQQTWMAMTKNQRKAGAADDLPQIQSVRAYILGVARHVVFGYYRKNGQKTEFDPEVDNLAAIAPSVSQQLSLRRNIKRLELAMQSLPIDFQLIAEAFYIEEFTGPELAEMFNLPEGTIRSRIKRAKATIDELMRRWDIRLGKAAG
jgi:RNA polymerase sigma-70 factor (ECF subfamily)